MAFQSRFQSFKKLVDCAIADKDHIGEHTLPAADRQGPHISLIHEALNAWAQKQSPVVKPVAGNEVADKRFGPDTARVVTAFKKKKNILNFRGEIDPIVGIKTIGFLDLELPPIPDAPTDSRTIADIVVKFQGAFSEGTLSPNSVLSKFRIFIYQPMPNQAFGDKVLLHPFNGRALFRVGRLTNTIGTASLGVFASVTVELATLLGSLNMSPGKVFIHGSSSGGRNAIDFAAQLSQRGFFKPHLVASVDAAFFQADTSSRPEAFLGEPKTIPAFSLSAGTTPNRHNFFQTVGNHSKLSVTQGVLFTSKMAGEEIHGTVGGFQNNDLTRFQASPLTVSDDDAHVECSRRGTPEAERLIADELLLRG